MKVNIRHQKLSPLKQRNYQPTNKTCSRPRLTSIREPPENTAVGPQTNEKQPGLTTNKVGGTNTNGSAGTGANYTWQENKYTASASTSSSSWQLAPTTQHSSSSSSWQHRPQTQRPNQETERKVTLLPNTYSHNEQKEQATSESKQQWTPTLKRTRDTRTDDTRPNPQSDKEEYQHKDWKKKW